MSSDLPEDVIEDLELAKTEVEKSMARVRKPKKKRYPSNSDIARVIKELAMYARIDPEDFPDIVRERLEELGFYPWLVTDERIWRVFETLARRGEL